MFIIRGLYDCRTRLLSVSNSRRLHGERLTEVGQDPAHAPIVLARAAAAFVSRPPSQAGYSIGTQHRVRRTG